MRASLRMRSLRALSTAVVLVLILPATAAFAQVSVDPTVTPELNTGGWVRGMAFLLGVIGAIALLLVIVSFLRFAPRFSTDETSFRVVRADRVRPGEELPRRTVDVKAAAPVVVAPPPLPQPAGVAVGPAAASAAAPAAPAPAAAPAPDVPTTAPPAPAGPGAEAPSTDAPQATPGSEGAPAEADAATQQRETPDAAVSEPAPAPAAPAAATAPHADVSLDQEVFEQTLQELLAKGTDKRVAEGQARRAAMIAARKKAAGG